MDYTISPDQRFRTRSKPDPDAPRFEPTPYVCADPASLPRRDFLYGRHLIRGTVCVTIAPGGVGKTATAIAESLDMTTGRGIFGRPRPPLRVWFWNGEDPIDELNRRYGAARLRYGISEADLGGRLFVDSGVILPLKLATMPSKAVIVAVPTVDAIISRLKAHRIDAFIADPFVTTHGVPENDNTAIGAVADAFKRIAYEADVGVELIHHVRKSNGEIDLTTEDARGGKALTDAGRFVRVFNVMRKEDAELFGIPERERRRYIRIDDGKQNMTRPAEVATWRKLEDVDLGNVGPSGEPSDRVQVVAVWKPPGVLDNVQEWQLSEVQRRMGDQHFAQAPTANDWLGRLVAQVLGIELPKGNTQVRRIIEIWVTNGAIVKAEREDTRRHRRQPTYVCGTRF